MGAAFSAWVPLFIFNTGTQGPLFKVGFTTAAVCAAGQAIGIVLLKNFGSKVKDQAAKQDVRVLADEENK